MAKKNKTFFDKNGVEVENICFPVSKESLDLYRKIALNNVALRVHPKSLSGVLREALEMKI